MPDVSNPKTIIVIVYLSAVALIGLLSLITIAVLNKNAEKPSTAKIVGITYVSLFTLLFILSLRALAHL